MKKKTKKVILGTVGVLTATNMIRAAFFRPKKQNFGEKVEVDVDMERVANHLSKAITFRTISNPDPSLTDWSEFQRFHEFLDEAYPLINKTLNKEIIGEANIIYRWKGKNPDLDPIALLSHQDVVPVTEGTEGDWEHPAFEGFNDGEFIWGRGSLDMKNHLICVMDAIEDLIQEGFEPERDIYLLFGQDEEVVASEHGGARQIMETLRDRGIHLESIIDEGGAILPFKVKGIANKQLAGIGIAEKGYCDIEISLNHKGGHSSNPPVHSGLGYMATVIQDLENNQFEAKIEPFLTELFNKIGRNVSYPARLVACNLPILMPTIKQIVKRIPAAASMARTTTAVTMAQGSPAPNVLPQTPTITVNFRQMPGTTTEDVINHIKKVVRYKDINIRVVRSKEASRFSPTDSRAFKVIEEICMQNNPDSIVAPYLVMGGTDSCFYEPICENIYRFAPFVVDVSLLMRTHATNEKIPISALSKGVKFFKTYVKKLASE